MEDYYFLRELFLRCPVYDYGGYAPGELGVVLRDPVFQVGLFLASPGLFGVLEAKGFEVGALSGRERLSVLRYYNRMCFRATPFGGFASFSLAAWGGAGAISLGELKLHLGLDREVGLRLAGEVDLGLIRANPSMYALGKEFRFIRTLEAGASFDLESLERNALTVELLSFCADGFRPVEELIDLIRRVTDCAEKAAVDYLEFLVAVNVLLPASTPNIIGADYGLRQDGLAGQLAEVPYPSVAALKGLTARVMALLPDEKINSVFYAGLEREVQGGLGLEYQPLIKAGLGALARLVPAAQPALLQGFIQDFKAKYDRRRVRLLEALDPDAGLGYGPLSSAAGETALLRAIKFDVPVEMAERLDWSAAHRLLLERWRANGDSYAPLILAEADLRSLPVTASALPPTLPVMFRPVGEGIYLESAGGATATALIGRFTPWSSEVWRLGRELAAKEAAANPAVVFADIGMLGEGHADNINRREAVYRYELPINCVSILPAERQLALSDLWVSVTGDRLVLESASLKKEVIPRLSSAYNYSRTNLALCRLLGDLQYQGLQSNFSFNLEQFFPGLAHYPRVVYGQVILSPATWYLDNLKQLTDPVSIQELRRRLHWPPVIALSRSDQQLVFRLDEADDVRFLLECLRGMERAVLQEFFLPDGPRVNQFIAFLAHDREVYPGIISEPPVKTAVTPAYMLGSQWLYLKLYCSPAQADAILSKKLAPLLRQWPSVILRSWFFIRYRDPGYHIRLRLELREDALGQVLTELKKRLGPALQDQLIREYQADTYRRELERYGPDIIRLVELWFHGSSELVLAFLQRAGPAEHSLAFVSVSELLDRFIPEAADQLVFLEQMVQTFYTEFSGDSSLKVDLDQKYRELKKEIDALLADPDYYRRLKLLSAAGLFTRKTTLLWKVTRDFSKQRKQRLLADLVHMHLNRLFSDRQRQQELVIYYCLYKQRRTRAKRS